MITLIHPPLKRTTLTTQQLDALDRQPDRHLLGPPHTRRFPLWRYEVRVRYAQAPVHMAYPHGHRSRHPALRLLLPVSSSYTFTHELWADEDVRRLKMMNSKLYRRNAIRKSPPYHLIIKRYWKTLIGTAGTWFLCVRYPICAALSR